MNHQLESIRSSSRFHILDLKNTRHIKGGEGTKGGSVALYSEDLFNENGSYIGYRTHYKTWGSDEDDGTTLCLYDVEFTSRDTIV